MSNHHRLSHRLLSLISAGLLVSLCLCLAPGAHALEAAAQVVVVRGGVAVERDGGMLPLKAKDPIYVSDTVRTNDGRVQIMFSDHSLVNLGQQTVFTVSEYRFHPETKDAVLKTRVDEGVFRVVGGAISKIAPKEFTTETPTATIGIRGSMYAGMFKNKKLTVLFEGGLGIYVMNFMGTVDLNKPNLMTTVGEGQKPAPPKPAMPGDIQGLYQQLYLRLVGGGDGDGGQGGKEGAQFAAGEPGGDEPAPGGDDGNGAGGNGGQGQGAPLDAVQGKLTDDAAVKAKDKSKTIATYSGFVAGLAYDMPKTGSGQQSYLNANPQDFVLQLNDGQVGGKLAVAAVTTAYVVENDFPSPDGGVGLPEATANGSPASQLVTSTHSLDLSLEGKTPSKDASQPQAGLTAMASVPPSTVTAEGQSGPLTSGTLFAPKTAASQPADYATWGYWGATWTEPGTGKPYQLEAANSYWVAGQRTPGQTLQGFTGKANYSGAAMGVRIIDGLTPQGLQLPPGSLDLQVDFGQTNLNQAVRGHIVFPEIISMPIGPVAENPTFSAKGDNAFTASILDAQSSSVHGAFYGPKAQSVGGNFQATYPGQQYQGIFVGNKK